MKPNNFLGTVPIFSYNLRFWEHAYEEPTIQCNQYFEKEKSLIAHVGQQNQNEQKKRKNRMKANYNLVSEVTQ